MASDATDGVAVPPEVGESTAVDTSSGEGGLAPHTGPGPADVGGTPPGDDAPTPTPGGAPEGNRRRNRWVIEWAVIIVLAVVVAIVVRAFVFQTFYIPSGSMEPTLKIGDRIVVNKLAYHFHGVHRGDIVVFTTPPNENCAGPPVADLVKRVIGMPGETISGVNGKVEINGKVLPEPWLPKIASSYTSTFGPIQIPKGDYFMMGDNRVDSCDSRSWGPVSGSTFVGHVIMRIWPLSHITFF